MKEKNSAAIAEWYGLMWEYRLGGSMKPAGIWKVLYLDTSHGYMEIQYSLS